MNDTTPLLVASDDVDLDAVRAAAASVPDPELPPVTLGMLGMVHDVRLEEGRVVVELLPTFSGCPATEMMGRDVRAAIVDRVDAVDDPDAILVRWLFEPQWTTERISEVGHDRLKEFGIAPPTGGGVVTGGPPRDGRRTLPVSVARDGDPDADPAPAVTCPYCDSEAVEEDSPFGPTPCRASWFCRSCAQPFERFKPL